MRQFHIRSAKSIFTAVIASALLVAANSEAEDSRFATADSRGRYVHVIDLVDSNFRKIDPASDTPQPYSPVKTCGKCHDYDAISHGWHFNAMMGGDPGRASEPWIWSDGRTGTHIPLSYREWAGTYRPESLGISAFQMTQKFGGHFPGGGPGQPPKSKEEASESEDGTEEGSYDRFQLAGELAIDCLMCHSNDRSYSPTARMEQIEDENFAWAPTVAAGLATITGKVGSIKDGSDPKADDIQKKMPRLTYDAGKFRPDGKVFFDIRRQPLNESCYHCHTVMRTDGEARWTHDDDVHLRAGMKCTDCHRNGISHQTVRAFEGEEHPNATATTLSCRGCHLGEAEDSTKHHAFAGGRLGSPKPLHKGIPPIHFEKMSCTSCHSGPVPDAKPGRFMTSKAHDLGHKDHRGSQPNPGIVAPVFLQSQVTEGGETRDVYTPHNMMWPAFWGSIENDRIVPLDPERVYSLTRKALRVRKDFAEELTKVRLSSTDKKKLLGEFRAKVPEQEWSDEERKLIDANIKLMQDAQVKEKLLAAFVAIAESDRKLKPVYVAGGKAWQLSENQKDLVRIEDTHLLNAAEPYAWPLAHDVRPARWSLGITGCIECHSDESPIFYGEVTAIAPLPDDEPIEYIMHELQGGEPERLSAWNQMFEGRNTFKIVAFTAIGLVALIVLAYLMQLVSSSLDWVSNRLFGSTESTN